MKKHLDYYYIIYVIIFLCASCDPITKDIDDALKVFDNSLDSLITEATFAKRKNFIFGEDTLRNNPKVIEETYYTVFENDAMKVDANCSSLKFEGNTLVIWTTVDILGNKHVRRDLYFDDLIDNKLISNLRENNSETDTTYYGNVIRYDSIGRVVKEVTSGVWKEINNRTGSLIVKDSRVVEVYKYTLDDSVHVWRRDYFNKKYDVDSLKISPIISYKYKAKAQIEKPFQYSYTYDEYGNWITRKSINVSPPDIKYRIIQY